MSHGGRGDQKSAKKVPKKCHVFFEWPLAHYSLRFLYSKHNKFRNLKNELKSKLSNLNGPFFSNRWYKEFF